MPRIYKKRSKEEVESSFLSRVEKTESCWLWLGSFDTFGYGKLWVDGENITAHRYSYTLYKGEIPIGLNIMHSCDNPRCCRPEHLSAGTQKQNIYDAIAKGRFTQKMNGGPPKDFCINGHDLSDAKNIYMPPSGKRRCQPCRAKYNRDFKNQVKLYHRIAKVLMPQEYV